MYGDYADYYQADATQGFGGFWDDLWGGIKRGWDWVKQNVITGHIPPVGYQPPIVVGGGSGNSVQSFLGSPMGMIAVGGVLLLLLMRRE